MGTVTAADTSSSKAPEVTVAAAVFGAAASSSSKAPEVTVAEAAIS